MQSFVCPPSKAQLPKPVIGIANITDHTLVPNFKASNWIEGGAITVQQIQLGLMNGGVSWTSCPLDRPFLINGSLTCGNCPSSAPIYNLSSTLCISCPHGQTFSDSERKCVDTCCTDGKYYNFNAKKCLCPQAQPFEDADGKCITCLLPNFFNNATRRCESCPENSIYNLQLGKCVACPPEKPIAVGLECVGC